MYNETSVQRTNFASPLTLPYKGWRGLMPGMTEARNIY